MQSTMTGDHFLTKFLSVAWLLILLGSVSGCTTLNGMQSRWLGEPEFPLLSPTDFPRRQQFNQVLTIKKQTDSSSNEHSLIALWSTPEKKLLFSALTATGQPLISAQLIDNTLTYQTTPFLPPSISVESILNQIQLAHWPEKSIQEAIVGTRWSFTERSNVRQLSYSDRLVLEITQIDPQRIELVHHLRGITVGIETIQRENLR